MSHTQSSTNKHSTILAMLSCAVLTIGCANNDGKMGDDSQTSFYGTPGDEGNNFVHEQPQSKLYSDTLDCSNLQDVGAALNYRVDKPLSINASNSLFNDNSDPMLSIGLLLSPGDLIEVSLEDGEGFNGRYIVDNNGFIKLPLIGAIEAGGSTANKLEAAVEIALIKAEIFQPASATVTIQVLNWSSIEVSVAGAVFQPGRVLINQKGVDSIDEDRVDAYGDYSDTRLLSEAIRAASGIRPDAKIDQIILIRKGWQVQVDMTGILSGEIVKDYPLVAGDRVIVPSTGCFQSHLVRPSQITPKGFRVFMSNLIDSSGDNSSAGIGRYSTSLPYGTRLLQAAVSANCVGGKDWTNAPRRIVLSSQNPITGETQVIERSVEQLMTMPGKGYINPYLMPNDAVACYDSTVTNFRDIARTVADILLPIKLL